MCGDNSALGNMLAEAGAFESIPEDEVVNVNVSADVPALSVEEADGVKKLAQAVSLFVNELTDNSWQIDTSQAVQLAKAAIDSYDLV